MALLRSDEDIKQEIKKLEKELVKYPNGPTRRKIKARIARLNRFGQERLNEENRRRRLGMKKKVLKPKVKKNDIKPEKVVKKKPFIIISNPAIEREVGYIKIDEKLQKERKSEKREKYYCSSCGKECVKTYSNINDIYKHKYYCEKCAKQKYGMFEIEE